MQLPQEVKDLLQKEAVNIMERLEDGVEDTVMEMMADHYAALHLSAPTEDSADMDHDHFFEVEYEMIRYLFARCLHYTMETGTILTVTDNNVIIGKAL